MNLFLDEAESAFLQAVLTGTDASPAFSVARGQEVASVQYYSEAVISSQKERSGPGEDAAAILRPDEWLHAFPSPSDNQAAYKQANCGSPHTPQPPCAPTPNELTIEQPWQQSQLQQQPQLQLQDAPGRVSEILCSGSAASQSRQIQPQPPQGQHLSPIPAQQQQQQSQSQLHQEAHGHVTLSQIRHKATSPVHPAAAAGQFMHCRLDGKPLSAAPAISPRVAGTAQPHSGPPATDVLPTTTPARSPYSPPMPTLPNSYSIISTVSEASTAATSGTAITTTTTATNTSPRPHRRRRSSSTNLAGAGAGGGALGSSSDSSSGSSSSRRFSSEASIPTSAADSATAEASAMVHEAPSTDTVEAPASIPVPAASAGVAAAATAAASTTPSCRRAHGLLQRIQSLEAQLTELLVADTDVEAYGEVSGSNQAAAAAASAAVAAAGGTDPNSGSPPCRPTAAHHNNTQARTHSPSQPHRHQAQSALGHHKGISSSSSSVVGNEARPAEKGTAGAAVGCSGSVSGATTAACIAPQGAAFRRQSLVFSVAEQLCRDYNSSGVALMEAGLDEAAREQLEKALLLAGPEGLLEGRPDKQRELQIVAHNNLACYCRKLGQPALALQHLQHTARLESTAVAAADVNADAAGPAPAAEGCTVDGTHPDAQRKQGNADTAATAAATAAAADPGVGGEGGAAAITHGGLQGGPTAATLLNLAACSSSLGQHMQALAYAARAVQASAAELQISQAALEAALLQGLPQVQLWELLPQLRRACRGATTQLAMAYYNRAVEQEHLHQWQAALESYRVAVDVASRFMGRGDDLTLTMQQSAEAFKVQLRKLERQGKVRATGRVANHGVAVCGAAATVSGAPSRSHPRLRPLLRCVTAPTTTTTVTAAGTGYAAAAAAAAASASASAAQAMAGLPAKALSRTPGLPCIAPGRSASLSLISGTAAPTSESVATTASAGSGAAGSVSPVAWTKVSAESGAPAPALAAVLPLRRALSAGRAWPPQRLSGASLPLGLGLPASAPVWEVPQMRRGSTSHVTAGTATPPPPSRGSASHVPSEAAARAAAAEPLLRRSGASAGSAVRGYGDTMQMRRCTAWSPPLPPRPRPEVPGDAGGRAGAGDIGRECSGGGAQEPPHVGPHVGVRCRPGGPPVATLGHIRGGGGADVGPPGVQPPPQPLLQPRCSSSLAAAGVCELGANGTRHLTPMVALSQPPVPTPLVTHVGVTVAAATTAKAQHAPASHAVVAEKACSLATSLTAQQHREAEEEEKLVAAEEEGSLAAVAAAAVAAAAELARIYAADEDAGQGQVQGQGQGWMQVDVDAQVGHKMRGSGHGPSSVKKEPKRVSLVVRSSVQQPPARDSDAVGRGDGGSGGGGGGGDLCRKGNGSPMRPAVYSAACPGSMLVPKRDGVAV